MRIAYICADPGVPVFGQKGCSVHVQEILRAMLRSGARVDLFASACDGPIPPGLGSVRLHPLKFIRQAPGLANADQLNAQLACSLHQAQKSASLMALQKGDTDEGVPSGFDLAYERYSLWSYAGMEFARAAGIPGVLEVNAPLIEEEAQHRGLSSRAEAEHVARRAFAAADSLIAVSSEVAQYLAGVILDSRRVHVVPNGVDPSRFAENLRPDWPRLPGEFLVGFIGTLKPWHGLDVLAQGFAIFRKSCPEARLLIVGDGPGKGKLLANLQAAGVSDNAYLVGAVPPERVPGLLASMDVAVAPAPKLASFYFSPLKLYEYMAAGRAVVAGRIGQMAELIQDGVTGLLVAPGDPAELASALERLVRDPGLRQCLGQRARDFVERERTWDAAWQRILQSVLPSAQMVETN